MHGGGAGGAGAGGGGPGEPKDPWEVGGFRVLISHGASERFALFDCISDVGLCLGSKSSPALRTKQ